MSPYEALYGLPMSPLPRYSPEASSVLEVDEFLRVREILNVELAFYLQQEQAKMKKQEDQHR